MTIVSGDILRTTCNFTLGGTDLYQNIYHHIRSGVAVFTDQAHVDALETWAEAAYGELVTYTSSTVVSGLASVDQVEWGGAKWEVVANVGTFVLGFTPIGSVEVMPNQIAPYVIFKTARPKTVGRKFLFPMVEEAFGLGLLVAGAVTDIANYADDVVNDITLSPLNYLVPGVPRTAVNDWQEFTLALVGNVAGTQRRRRIGVGA